MAYGIAQHGRTCSAIYHMKTKPRLVRITTVPVSLKLLLRGQLSYFASNGFDVLALSADGREVTDIKREGIRHQVIPMTRKITPIKDFLCLIMLIRVFLKFKPHIVHTHTPKAGLLGMLAAWLCRVPVRMHTVAGLPLMETRGIRRWLLTLTERVTYACAGHVYPNSYGLCEFIQQNFRLPARKNLVIGKGSTNGIDTDFFSVTADLRIAAGVIRKKYGIEDDAVVFSFIGRIVRDKGIGELIAAYKKLHVQFDRKNIYLLFIGSFEQDLNPLTQSDYQFLHEHPRVILAGFQDDVRPWLLASDIFIFPSYREGFPNVVLQACCLGVPCIVSDINGCNEIIVNEKSGLIVKPKDEQQLYEAMKTMMVASREEKLLYSKTARKQIIENYSQQFVWSELTKEYFKLLNLE
jgi:glycosyltransferase involved in cell wall biosynthesis